ncbi:hypothetical protein [Legionella spiritensis]|uniref:hypothetical protein n=1 Tax=Legionella spiritensis TaxID=452 RepID=UPI001E3A5026|nr:hypothetical protein [Legionella spiritensis]
MESVDWLDSLSGVDSLCSKPKYLFDRYYAALSAAIVAAMSLQKDAGLPIEALQKRIYNYQACILISTDTPAGCFLAKHDYI